VNTEAVSLNLSRKWRSQNFDQIVGQDLVVRILKNSLYAGHYFPVYLFAGQRGCGKTSMARIFAAALIVKLLSVFSKTLKIYLFLVCHVYHVLQCSTVSIQILIEIDAASYTGVDHMRNIIESSSLLPIMGRKRVYLIDEAHMLSKAAFNAALKVLEEPSESALFICYDQSPKNYRYRSLSFFSVVFYGCGTDFLKKHLQKFVQRSDSIRG